MTKQKTRDMFAEARANSLPMMLQKFHLILIVEGCADAQFFFPYFQKNVHVEPAGDKIIVRKMIHSVAASGEKKCGRIRALVDRDYDFITGQQSDNEQLIYTDANCLETMIWMTDDNSVLSTIVSKMVQVDTLDEIPFSDIYDRTYQAASLLGLIRLTASLHKEWDLNLKPLMLRKDMLDEQDMLQLERVVDDILDNDECTALCTRDELIGEVRRLEEENIDQWQLMQGHDLSEAFVFHIKKNCTFYPEDWPGWDDLKEAIRDFESKAQMAANKAGMRETDCFRQIGSWIEEYKEKEG